MFGEAGQHTMELSAPATSFDIYNILFNCVRNVSEKERNYKEKINDSIRTHQSDSEEEHKAF